MKLTHYFSHDFNSREDDKIQNLIYKHGFEGYGLYWAIVEMLYQNEGYLSYDCERIAFSLRTDKDKIKSIINDFNLFETHGENFYSHTILERIKQRISKSNKAKKSAKARWDKVKKGDANAMRNKCDRNAIKEKKVKEKKVKIITPKTDLEIAITDYSDMRKKIRKPLTERAKTLLLKKLENLSGGSEEKMIEILEQSIMNSWQGIFPLKEEQRKQSGIVNLDQLA